MPTLLTFSDDEVARLLVCLSFASANRDDVLEAFNRDEVTEDVVFVHKVGRLVKITELDLENLMDRLLAAAARGRQARFSVAETGRVSAAYPPITNLPVERPSDPVSAADRILLLRKALNAIVEMRDRGASAADDNVLPDWYECFDDWAADLAEAALVADSATPAN